MKATLLEFGPVLRRAVLLTLTAGVPVVFVRATNDPINVPKLAMLTIGVAVVAAIKLAELLQGAPRESLRRLMVPALAIAIPLIVAWAAAPHRGWSLFGQYGRYQGLVPYLLVIVFGVLLADAFGGRAHQIAWALAWAAGIAGAYALLQVVGGDPLKWALAQEGTSTATSTLGNPNFTGGFLGICLPVILGLWATDAKRKVMSSILGLLAVGGWIAAFSQGGWAAGAAGLAAAGGFVLAPKIGRARTLGLVVAALVALAAVGAVVAAVAAPTNKSIPGTIRLRGEAWRAAGKMAVESPVLGRGPNAFALEGVQHRSQRDALRFNYNFPDDPHSVLLSLLVGAGVLGAGGYLVMAGWSLRAGRRLDDTNVLSGAFFGSVIAYFVQSLVSIDEPSLRLAFWAVLAGMVATSVTAHPAPIESRAQARKRKRRRAGEPMRAIPAVALVALLALGAVFYGGRFVLADARVRWGTLAFLNGDLHTGVQEFSGALALRDEAQYRWKYGEFLGQAAVAEQDAALFNQATLAFGVFDDLPNLEGVVAYGRVLDDWLPTDATVGEEGVRVYERALALDPLNPLIRVEFADLLVDVGRAQDALDLLEPIAESTGRRYASVWGGIASARFDLGDTDGARDAAERALMIDPEEPQAQAVRQNLPEGQ